MKVEENESKEAEIAAAEGKPIVKEGKVPRVLIEFLVYGVEADKKKIKKMMDSIQEQMVRARKGKYARVLWYIDKGEKTDEEKREWLIEHSKAKYFVFTKETYIVAKDYVKETLFKIKRLEDAITAMRIANIVVAKKPAPEPAETTETDQPATELKVVE
jgi:hypothetical protein